jgi:hypothetical protein
MVKQHSTRIEGACHCGNIRYTLIWPDVDMEIPVRACGCTYCQKHGGIWTSHSGSELSAEIKDESMVSKYKQGTKTAEMYVCAVCGIVPFVTSDIENNLYSVVNANTFEGIESSRIVRSSTDIEGESTSDRLERRRRNWIPNVRISNSIA